jgi:hydrogenase-4 component B
VAREDAVVSAALAVLAVALAALSGLPGLALPRDSTAADRSAAALLGLALLCAGAAALFVDSGAPEQTLTLPWLVLGDRVAVGVDALSAFFLLPTLGIPSVASLYALAYWPAREHPRSARRLRLAFGLIAGGAGLVLIARHAFAFLVGWEVMALAAFFSITAEDEREGVRRAGFVYLACTRASTLALIGAFALLHAASGGFALTAVPALDAGASRALFGVALVGFLLKAGAMPLHLWLPGAHAMAPTHVSAVLSGMLIKVGIYGVVRFASLLPPLPLADGAVLLALGMLSAVLGVAFALGQHHLKRLLAYHSIENIGIILMGVGLAQLGRSLGQPEVELLGMAGALLHVWNHALFKALLFLGAGAVLRQTGSGEIDRLGGLARRLPVTALTFAVGAVAICGLPPLNGFVSELLVYLGLLRTLLAEGGGARGLAVAGVATLALVGGLAAACFVKAFGVVFLGEPRTPEAADAHEAPRPMLAAMAALALACAAIGLAPQLAVPLLERAVHDFDPGLAAVAPRLGAAAPFGAISLAGVGLVAALAALTAWAMRRRLRPAQRAVTWDCGYAAPSVRMQYTSSSFAAGLVGLFRWALWPEVDAPRLSPQPFPGPARLHTELPDPVLDRVTLPAARWLAHASTWFRWVQRGRVHSYVLYILVAIVFGFLAARGEPG